MLHDYLPKMVVAKLVEKSDSKMAIEVSAAAVKVVAASPD